MLTRLSVSSLPNILMINQRRELSSLKTALRKEIRSKLKALSTDEVMSQSSLITTSLKTIPLFSRFNEKPKTMSVYLPMEGSPEVNTWEIIDELLGNGHRVCVPLVTGKAPQDMQMVQAPSLISLKSLPLDNWKIPQPCDDWSVVDASEIDVVLLPCVALGRDCRRLGHGGGYYDSFLEKASRDRLRLGLDQPVFIGLALREQVVPVESIPIDHLDMPLHFIVSPEELIQRE